MLARYGGSWRGIKPKVAAEQGAIGCIIYSDPGGDGCFQGDVYPKGGWRGRDSVQRGSVADMPIYSGDPLTPGVAATAEAARLPVAEARVLTRIPVLPISYGDAQPLLAALAGPMAPESWRGALPIPYRLGPGPARVHLRLRFDWSLKPIHDVVAVLAGATEPDEWIVRGNHHDAWVNGALDPVAGLSALLAEAKAVGELARGGWRPARTLVYAAWDGEEAGLLGSTEWAEAHAEELRAKAVAYLNTDALARGFLGLDGSHSLERYANEVARDVVDPPEGRLGARADARRARRARRRRRRAEAPARAAGPAARRARLRLRLHALPAAPGHRVAQLRLRRRGAVRPVPLDLRLDRPLPALRRPRLRLRRGRRAHRPAPDPAAGRGRGAAAHARPGAPRRSASTSRRSRS